MLTVLDELLLQICSVLNTKKKVDSYECRGIVAGCGLGARGGRQKNIRTIDLKFSIHAISMFKVIIRDYF